MPERRRRCAGLAGPGSGWARGSGRPDEAIEAARQLGPEQLDPGERLALRAWLDQAAGRTQAESAALERWLQLEPAATRRWNGSPSWPIGRAGTADRVAELRRRKAEVERALDSYRHRLWHAEPPRTADERSELARLAEAAGRRHEARALYAWALRPIPAIRPPGRAWPGSIGPRPSGNRRALSTPTPTRPWPEPAPVNRFETHGTR